MGWKENARWQDLCKKLSTEGEIEERDDCMCVHVYVHMCVCVCACVYMCVYSHIENRGGS